MATHQPAAGRLTGRDRVTDLGSLPVDAPLARTLATVVAATFLLVGVLGFVPGITTNVGDMTFAGHESGSELLGIFQVSILHNIVHLLFGVVGLAMARKGRTAALYLFAGGAIYLLLALYGAVVEHDHDANFVPVNNADDVLHLGLGVGMIALGALAVAKGRQDLSGGR
jgi:hypothetical protein